MWASICRRANLQGVRLHDLRHTVGSMAHRAGLSQREIASLLGHKQMSTTARYLHSLTTHEQRAAAIAADAIYQHLAVKEDTDSA